MAAAFHGDARGKLSAKLSLGNAGLEKVRAISAAECQLTCMRTAEADRKRDRKREKGCSECGSAT